jgi:hypothetical protein
MLREASNAARGLDTTRNGVICFTGEEKPIAVGGQILPKIRPLGRNNSGRWTQLLTGLTLAPNSDRQAMVEVKLQGDFE